MEELTLVKGTFIALDVDNPESGGDTVRLVGTVVGGTEKVVHLEDPDNNHVAEIEIYSIVKGYWAPMGYRP